MDPLPPTLHAPLRRVLVASDFTEGADAALARALRLPLAPDARVHLVHVLPADAPADRHAEARAALVRALGQARAAAGLAEGAPLQTLPEVLQGTSYVELVRCARRTEAELVVVGRHGQRPVRDMFLGSTAERVVRKGDTSVLVVHTPPAGPYQRPLVGSDLGDGGRAALALALRVVGRDVASVRVVHAFNVPFEGFVTPWPSAAEPSDYHQAFEQEATRALDAQVAPFRAAGVPVQPAVRAGEPRVLLVAEVVRGQHDLLAVGTHTRAGLAHALLGSVAAWTVVSAPCDVLVVRTPGVTVTRP